MINSKDIKSRAKFRNIGLTSKQCSEALRHLRSSYVEGGKAVREIDRAIDSYISHLWLSKAN